MNSGMFGQGLDTRNRLTTSPQIWLGEPKFSASIQTAEFQRWRNCILETDTCCGAINSTRPKAIWGLLETTEISRTYYLEHEVFKSVTPFGFFDFGYVRNNEPSPIETLEESLFSVGVGLSIAMASNTSVPRLDWHPSYRWPNNKQRVSSSLFECI